MGRSSVSGPLYGAKSLLASAYIDTIGPSVTDAEIYELLVPATEDWYITNIQAYASNQGNGGTVDVESPNGTSVMTGDITLTTGAAVAGVVKLTPGEDEGFLVPGGARIHVEASDGATTPITDVTVAIYGFIRTKEQP